MPNDIYKALNAITIEMYNNLRSAAISPTEPDTYLSGYQAAIDDLFGCIDRLTTLVAKEEKEINSPYQGTITTPSPTPYTPYLNITPTPYKTINEPYTGTPTWTCNTQTTTQTKENSHG